MKHPTAPQTARSPVTCPASWMQRTTHKKTVEKTQLMPPFGPVRAGTALEQTPSPSSHSLEIVWGQRLTGRSLVRESILADNLFSVSICQVFMIALFLINRLLIHVSILLNKTQFGM